MLAPAAKAKKKLAVQTAALEARMAALQAERKRRGLGAAYDGRYCTTTPT